MSRRASSLRRSSAGPAIGNPAPSHPIPPLQRGAACSGAVWSLVQFGLCVVLISLVLSLLALPWFELSWWKIFRRCVSIAAAFSLWLWVRKLEGRTFRSYGFSAAAHGRRQLIFGVLLGLGALAFCFGLGLVSGACHVAVSSDRLRLWRTVIGFLPAAFLVSVLEELVFRGFILQRLLACSTPCAVVISSALYAVVHVKTGSLTPATWRELGGLFLLGGVLAVSYLVTRQLYLAVGLHAALAYGARVNKLLVGWSDAAASWFVGTSRLVDGIFSWFVLAGMGGIVVWWATRGSHAGGRRHEG